ncbi:drug/metabolite transporter (DMT)-like permease [Clostridiales Family XIII bacterium PM5-7]
MDKYKKNEAKGIVFLMVSAMIWGAALVAQKEGMENLGPFTFTALRCLLGGVSMIPIIWIFDQRKTPEQKEKEHNPKVLLLGGFLCGLALSCIAIPQQIGIQLTTVGKSGFITALYIVLVPLAGIFLKRKVEAKVWFAVITAIIGFYLMCMTEGFSNMNKGDLIMLLASVACVFHMYTIDYFVTKVDPIKLSCVHALCTGVICGIPALIFEQATLADIAAAAIPILYTGLASCAIGYTTQIIGQKYVEPSKASLLLSSETIFTMIAGMIFYGEILAAREYMGCALIFVAIIISQIKFKGKS